MDKDLIRKYKEETGKENVFTVIPYMKSTDRDMFLIQKKDVREFLDNYNDMEIPSREYVSWLEEQLKEKMI